MIKDDCQVRKSQTRKVLKSQPARLCHRDGKSRYLDDMPRVARYLESACARYAELAPLARLIDATRLETRTGTDGGRRVEIWIVPAGATFDAGNTTVVTAPAPKPMRKKAAKKPAE